MMGQSGTKNGVGVAGAQTDVRLRHMIQVEAPAPGDRAHAAVPAQCVGDDGSWDTGQMHSLNREVWITQDVTGTPREPEPPHRSRWRVNSATRIAPILWGGGATQS